jgi:hypothetical protein
LCTRLDSSQRSQDQKFFNIKKHDDSRCLDQHCLAEFALRTTLKRKMGQIAGVAQVAVQFAALALFPYSVQGR